MMAIHDSLYVNKCMLSILILCIFNKYYLIYFIDLICNIVIYIYLFFRHYHILSS